MASSFPRENIAPYLRQMGSRPQLTREQEYALVRRARKGDERARETLAVSNLAFVVSVAKKFAHRGARLDDLVQEGNVGLMKAIEHFDTEEERPLRHLRRVVDSRVHHPLLEGQPQPSPRRRVRARKHGGLQPRRHH